MSSIITPIYIGELNDKPLRFFKAPTDEPQMMWHSWDDLVASADLPRSLRRKFKCNLQRDWGSEIKTIATSEGITTIAPHDMAQGFIGSMIENGFFPASIEMKYTIQSVDAWNALTANLPKKAGMDLFFVAYRNTHKIGR